MNYIARLIITLLLFVQVLTAETKNKKVSLQLSWFNQFQFAGYYIAKEKGFYKELGLDVEIKPFKFGIDIPKEVSDNTIDFAIGREALILDRAKHHNIVALYALFQASPLVLLTTKESKINSINDFKNKRIMTTIANASEVSLKAMLKSKNVDLEDLNFLKHTHNINDLITKKTDIISAYTSKSPFILQKKGINYNMFAPKEYGFDMYSDLLFTSEHLLSTDIHAVNAFKKASLKGWEYAYSNIEESVELILEKYNTQNLSKEELIFEGHELKKLSFYNTNELGNIDKSKLKRIADLYNVMGLLENRVDIDEFIYYENSDNINLMKAEKEYLKEKKQITMCIDPNWMPFEKFDKNGKHIGMTADYYEIFKEKLKIDIKVIKTENWTKSLENVKNRNCDILSLAMETTQRKKHLNFTTPYLRVPIVIATKRDVAFINNIEAIKNKKVGVPKGYALIELLEHKYKDLNIIEVENIAEGLEKVNQGELFGYIGTLATISHQFQSGLRGELKISGKLFENWELGIGVRDDDKVLFNILEKVVNSIDSKKQQQILNNWISIKYEKGIDYTLIWQILIAVFIITLFLLYRQFLLKKSNDNLQLIVKKEVEKNREKDKMMFRQSKLAAMGEMIGNIAHQWRQPLNRINLSLAVIDDVLKKQTIENSIIENKIKVSQNNLLYMSDTIEDFANFFRPDKKMTTFTIQKLIDKVIKLIDSRLSQIELTIINKQNIVVTTYEHELLQVFLIILNNALDNFGITNVTNQKIEIVIEEDKDACYIYFKDNGGGILQEHIDNLFDPYFTTKFKDEGTGLGLYMAKMIIEDSMNGTLNVTSHKNETTFKIMIEKENKTHSL